jgi:hypothetical protein
VADRETAVSVKLAEGVAMAKRESDPMSSPMHSCAPIPGIAATRGLIDEGQEDKRKGHFETKNTFDIKKERPADIEGPLGTSINMRK